MRALPPADYFAVLAAKRRTVNVALADGSSLTVQRARLRLYAELAHIHEGDGEAEDKAIAYIERATGHDINEFDPADFLATYALLLDLNTTVSMPAILRVHGTGKAPLAFRYPGRWLASLVATLIGAGFTPEYVLEELDPDEAWLYLQEVQYAEWSQRQHDYSLSDVGRDKRGKQRKYEALPWVGTISAPTPRKNVPKVPAKMVPTGTIINLRDPDVVRRRRA